MKVAVTGATGFLGQAVVRALGDAAVPISRKTHGSNVLARPEWFAGIDAVIHAAGATPQRSAPEEIWETNVAGSLAVARAAQAARVPTLLLVSSCSVYGIDRAYALPETAAPRPQGVYGYSMLAAETNATVCAEGATLTLARVFNVYGPGGRGIVDRFLDAANTGLPLKLTHPTSAVRDLVHVDSVAAILVRLLGHAGTWNVGTGRGRTLLEVAKLVQRAAPSQRRPEIVEPAAAAPARVDHSVADTTKLATLGLRADDRLEAYVKSALGE